MQGSFPLICAQLRSLLVDGTVQAWLLSRDRGHVISPAYLLELHSVGAAAQPFFADSSDIPFLTLLPYKYVLIEAFEAGRRIIDDGIPEEEAWRRLEAGNWLVQADGGGLVFQVGCGADGIEERQIVRYNASLEVLHCASRTYRNFRRMRDQESSS